MIGIPMGTNCAPLLADLFLYSYANELLDKLIKKGKRSSIYHNITLMTLVLNLVYLSIFSGLAALMSADIARNL